MNIREKVTQELKAAMKAKDQDRLRAIKSLKAAVLHAETADGREQGPLTEAEAAQLIAKQVKQRRDSAADYTAQGREDLAEKEAAELKILEEFMPPQLSDEELEAEVGAIIAESGAASVKDMGKVMKLASEKLAGKADNSRVSQLVKTKLQNL